MSLQDALLVHRAAENFEGAALLSQSCRPEAPGRGLAQDRRSGEVVMTGRARRSPGRFLARDYGGFRPLGDAGPGLSG